MKKFFILCFAFVFFISCESTKKNASPNGKSAKNIRTQNERQGDETVFRKTVSKQSGNAQNETLSSANANAQNKNSANGNSLNEDANQKDKESANGENDAVQWEKIPLSEIIISETPYAVLPPILDDMKFLHDEKQVGFETTAKNIPNVQKQIQSDAFLSLPEINEVTVYDLPAATSQSAKPATTSQNVKPGTTSQNAKPATTSQGVKPAATSQNAKPATTSQVAKPAATSQVAKPAATSQSAKPAAVSQNAKPATTLQNAKPAAVSQNAKPAATTSQSVKPAATLQNAKPAATSQNAKPAAVSQSAKPATTLQNAKPATTSQNAKPSREVTLAKNQFLDVSYPGSGWVYLGELNGKKNLLFFGRKLSEDEVLFSFTPRNEGTSILHFYKNDILNHAYIDDYLSVTVKGNAFSANERITAPSYASLVPPSPHAKAEIEKLQNENESAKSVTNGKDLENAGAKIANEKPESTIEIFSDDPDDLLSKAKKAYGEKKYVDALSLVNDFLKNAKQKLDEGFFLKGQTLESKSAVQDIKNAIENYQKIIDNFPKSTLWETARKRIVFLKRMYVDIR